MKKQFEYAHTVSFEETNVMGNVYFVHFLSWQGKCREMFIKEKVPGLLALIESNELSMVTIGCSCEFFSELKAFDEIIVSMQLVSVTQNRIKMSFRYLKKTGDAPKIVAKGDHEVGCFLRDGADLTTLSVPEILQEALTEYAY
jgi:enediyne core biosynthesis thioesterase